jgi:class 3 adenylate cyclase
MQQPASVERRLAAILALDVVGYSRMMGVDEVGTLSALKAHRATLVDPAVARHHGRLVKTTGDGLLLEFASVVDAIACAVAIQRGMLSRNQEVAEDKRIVFRIGINIGDIIIDDGDIFGDGVNVAARLEGLCEPGGVCISRAANDQVRDKLSLSFADLGEHAVKNIARTIGVFGLSASDIAALPEERPSAEAPRAVSAPAPARPRNRSVFIGVGVAALAAAGLAAWAFGPAVLATLSPVPFDQQLQAVLAKSAPAIPADSRKEIVLGFVALKPNRAVALAPTAARFRYSGDWPTREMAAEKVLEKCQHRFGEPCALLAVNDAVVPPGAGGVWPVTDAPRVRYSGTFRPDRIPGLRAQDMERGDIANYFTEPSPKAAAYNVWGFMTVAKGTATQRQAEEQALQACRNEATRVKATDACHLYAVENRVVLPLRSTMPITAPAAAPPPIAPPVTAAASPEKPGEGAVRAKLLERMARSLPGQEAATRESQVASYQSSARNKAMAALPPSRSWRTAGWDSAATAEERVLEGCQVRHGAACLLIAVNDGAIEGDAAAPRPMPRVSYKGPFDPEKIPAVNEALRKRTDIAGYKDAPGAKAAALHPSGRLVTATGAASQREAETRALDTCNAEAPRASQGGPCYLYAAGNDVVLTRRAQAPVTGSP